MFPSKKYYHKGFINWMSSLGLVPLEPGWPPECVVPTIFSEWIPCHSQFSTSSISPDCKKNLLLSASPVVWLPLCTGQSHSQDKSCLCCFKVHLILIKLSSGHLRPNYFNLHIPPTHLPKDKAWKLFLWFHYIGIVSQSQLSPWSAFKWSTCIQ